MYQLHGTHRGAARERRQEAPRDRRAARHRRRRAGDRSASRASPRSSASSSRSTSDLEARLDPDCKRLLAEWPATKRRYAAAKYQFQVRDKVIELDLVTESLSHLHDPQGRAAALRGLGRHPHLAAARERRPGSSRSPPACSRSSARARIRRACSPAKAAPSAPTSASTTCRADCPPSGCRRRSTR